MKKTLPDDFLDGLVITLVILTIAAGLGYWLYAMN